MEHLLHGDNYQYYQRMDKGNLLQTFITRINSFKLTIKKLSKMNKNDQLTR